MTLLTNSNIPLDGLVIEIIICILICIASLYCDTDTDTDTDNDTGGGIMTILWSVINCVAE